MEVPVQYYQSIIAVQLAVAGALLWQIRFFDSGARADGSAQESMPHPRLRLLVALLVTATVFGALEAIRENAGPLVAILLTVGVAVSLLPVVVRVLRPLGREAKASGRDSHYWFAVMGLILFSAVVALIVAIP